MNALQITITELEATALRASIYWTLTLEREGKLELYDWQREALQKFADIGYPEVAPSTIDSA